jgi:LysR family transcriptional regulator, regulator for metE and metH
LKKFQIPAARLEIRHLAVLQALARWQSATAAAEHLGITSSAISHRLREAERRLGIHLTIRVGSGLRLTEAGERLCQSANRILDELGRSEIDAERIGRGFGSVIRLGIGTYSYFNWLPQFMRDFERSYPETKLELVGEATHQPLAHLRDETVDIILMPGQVVERGVVALPCLSDELVCVMAPGHALADRSYIEAVDLQDEIHITYSSEILPGFEYDSFFRPGGYYPKKLKNIALPEAVMELVSTGVGISILSSWIVTPRIARKELVSVRLTSSGLPLTWNVVLREKNSSGRTISEVAQTLASWLTSI